LLCEIRNSAAAEKSESAKGRQAPSEGGQKFLPRRVAKRLLRGLPPNPLPFCPPERSVFCSAFGGAISRSFARKRFELRSVIATNLDILKIQRRLVARSPDCPKTIFFVIPDSIGNPERFNIRQIMDSRFRRDDSKV